MTAPSATHRRGFAVLMLSASSCGILPGDDGIVVLGRVAGQSEEHLIEARLAEREVGDRDTGAGELREGVRDSFWVGDSGRERRRVGFEVHGYAECLRQHEL